MDWGSCKHDNERENYEHLNHSYLLKKGFSYWSYLLVKDVPFLAFCACSRGLL